MSKQWQWENGLEFWIYSPLQSTTTRDLALVENFSLRVECIFYSKLRQFCLFKKKDKLSKALGHFLLVFDQNCRVCIEKSEAIVLFSSPTHFVKIDTHNRFSSCSPTRQQGPMV